MRFYPFAIVGCVLAVSACASFSATDENGSEKGPAGGGPVTGNPSGTFAIEVEGPTLQLIRRATTPVAFKIVGSNNYQPAVRVELVSETAGVTGQPVDLPQNIADGVVNVVLDATQAQGATFRVKLRATTADGRSEERELDVNVRGAHGEIDTTYGVGGSVTVPRVEFLAKLDGEALFGGSSQSLLRLDSNGILDTAFPTLTNVMFSGGIAEGDFAYAPYTTTLDDGQNLYEWVVLDRLAFADGKIVAKYREIAVPPQLSGERRLFSLRAYADGGFVVFRGGQEISKTPQCTVLWIRADGSAKLSGALPGCTEAFSWLRTVVTPTGAYALSAEGLRRYQRDASSFDVSFASGVARPSLVGTEPATTPRALAVNDDGQPFIANTRSIVRFTATGALDASFVAPDNGVTDGGDPMLVVQADGKVVKAVRVGSAGGAVCKLFRYLANGAVDTSFGASGIVDIPVASCAPKNIALMPDGRLLVRVLSRQTEIASIRVWD